MKNYLFPIDGYGNEVVVDKVIDEQSEILEEGPYLKKKVALKFTTREWNPDYNQEALCRCGHPYYRHFDTYEAMLPCGCKYCECYTFKE